MHGLLRTLVKLTIASLIVGTSLSHFGVTPDQLAGAVGLSPERMMELVRAASAWALPNLVLGSLIIVPVWFVIYLFQPPRPRSK